MIPIDKSIEESIKKIEEKNEYLKTCAGNNDDLMKLRKLKSENNSEYLKLIIKNQNKIIIAYEDVIKELNSTMLEYIIKMSDEK